MTKAEHAEFCEGIRRLIPAKPTWFNDVEIPARTPLHTFVVALPTMVANGDGVLRRTIRKTAVRVYEPLSGEPTTLYEMGIPVVETGDTWHVNVGQKVPLNLERDNVTPAYLRDVRVAVLNAMRDHLPKEAAAHTWVHDALADERVQADAVNRVLELQFGERRVIENPFDTEANRNAVAAGYTLIPARTFSAPAWESIRRTEAALPSSQVTPAPKPFSADGRPLRMFEGQLTAGMQRFVTFANDLAHLVTGHGVSVQFANDAGWPFGGCYGERGLIVNVWRKGAPWFDDPEWPVRLNGWVRFLTHELAHEDASDHLDERYHQACCRIAGQIAQAMLERPESFQA